MPAVSLSIVLDTTQRACFMALRKPCAAATLYSRKPMDRSNRMYKLMGTRRRWWRRPGEWRSPTKQANLRTDGLVDRRLWGTQCERACRAPLSVAVLDSLASSAPALLRRTCPCWQQARKRSRSTISSCLFLCATCSCFSFIIISLLFW